jgi:hypothetical protein
MAGTAALTPADGEAADAASAVTTARAELGQLRQRFLRALLPAFGHLIVRPRLVSPTGHEAPWVLAESWRVPTRIRGRCLNDATHPALAHIQMGRPIEVAVADVVDWAVIDASGEIVEGGWSRDLRRLPDLPALAALPVGLAGTGLLTTDTGPMPGRGPAGPSCPPS